MWHFPPRYWSSTALYRSTSAFCCGESLASPRPAWSARYCTPRASRRAASAFNSAQRPLASEPVVCGPAGPPSLAHPASNVTTTKATRRQKSEGVITGTLSHSCRDLDGPLRHFVEHVLTEPTSQKNRTDAIQQHNVVPFRQSPTNGKRATEAARLVCTKLQRAQLSEAGIRAYVLWLRSLLRPSSAPRWPAMSEL